MPDFITENFYECDSVENFRTGIKGRGDTIYIVEVNRHVYDGWTCTCSAFKYKKFEKDEVYCKHIIEAQKEKYCGWQQFINGGQQGIDEDGNWLCPKCDRKAYARGWAV